MDLRAAFELAAKHPLRQLCGQILAKLAELLLGYGQLAFDFHPDTFDGIL